MTSQGTVSFSGRNMLIGIRVNFAVTRVGTLLLTTFENLLIG